VSHLLGHLHMSGGDTNTRSGWSYDPMWTLIAIGGQLAAIGPPLAVLLFLGSWRAVRSRSDHRIDRTNRRLLLCCGLPVLLFYAGVSLLTDIEANWPLAAYLPLIPLGAAPLIDELGRYAAILRDWKASPLRPRPKLGWLRRKPETLWQVAWHWTLGWGIVCAVLIAFGPYVRLIPGVPDIKGLDRITGHRDWAMDVNALRATCAAELGEPPEIMAAKYQTSSLLAFYLPDPPMRVYNANHWLGGRRTAYDFFPDTNLEDEALHGRTFLLFGADAQRWDRAFKFDSIEKLDGPETVFLARGFRGPIRTSEEDPD
jgi:hypothetical protein